MTRLPRFLVWSLAAAAAAALSTVSIQAGPPAQGGPPIDESDRVVLRHGVNPLARPQLAVGRTKADLPMDRIILSLALRPGAQQELDQLLVEQQDPASPNYHRWLTPEEFGARFGATDADVARVTSWLEGQGFRVDEVAKGRGWINFSGTASQVEAAFATEMQDYRVDGKLRHANATDPSIPRALASTVRGVVSLNSFPRHRQTPRTRQVNPSPDVTAGGEHYVGPGDFATIYNVNPLYSGGIDGTGVKIAIVGRTNIRLEDPVDFRTTFGLPNNDPIVLLNGPNPGVVSDDEEFEADLDIQWSGAVAPGAEATLVVSRSTMSTDGVDLSAQYIVDNDLADVMSTSFGLCESLLTPAGNSFYNGVWAQAAAQGITSFVSSGDSGAAGCNVGSDPVGSGREVSGLCSTPNNVCVGGTQFNEGSGTYWSNMPFPASTALSYIPEKAWNESGTGSGLWSSGGGASGIYAKPSWQSAPGVPNDGHRDVPDVSLTAALHDGYIVAWHVSSPEGGYFAVGGTSASSPSFAGLMALVVQKTGSRQGNANAKLYAIATNQYTYGGMQAFHDVTSGNNSVPGVSGFACKTGYDQATGLGSVDAAMLVGAFVAPHLSVGNVAVVEGNSGTTTAMFPVTLSAASASTVTVHYATVNGSATASSGDYTATSGTLTFTPGQTAKNVNVQVNGDLTYEANETFGLQLDSAVNALVEDPTGQATITNDDTPPSLSIDDVSVDEGNSGTRNASFTVSLSAVSGVAASAAFTTADGTATAGSDYTAVSGTVVVPAGQTTATINVPVKGDALIEADETFVVNLAGPVDASIADGQGVATILNDDTPGDAEFRTAVFKVSEAASAATVVVKRTGGRAGGATVDYATADGTAMAGVDYTATSGTLTFGSNRTTASFKVPITKDTLDEGDETVLLRLTPSGGPAATTVGAQSTAVLTIRDNDAGGKIRFSSANYSVSEGAGAATLTVKRVSGRASDVSVHYATAPATATGGGTDYADASGDLTFATSGPGASTQTITIPITQDALTEGAETFTVTLSSPTGGGVLSTPTVATVTILDDEPTVELSADAYSAKETQAGALVLVKRSGAADGVVTVDYATGGGTATPDVDYKPVAGTLTFPNGATSRSFVVPLVKDTLVEGSETVGIVLSNVQDVTHPPGTTVLGARTNGTLTIVDDDATPTLEFLSATYKASEGSPRAMITLKRSGSSSHAVTVDYSVTGGSATNGGVDYDLPPTGTITFPARSTRQTILVPLVNDTLEEGTETVDLILQNPQDLDDPGGPVVVGAQGAAELDITDTEATLQFSSATYRASEAAKSIVLTVRRTGPRTSAATVQYDVTGGTATRDTGGGGDYALAVPGTLSFAPGQMLQTIPITLDRDTVSEDSETIELTLSGAVGAELGTPAETVVTIRDNDRAGKVQFAVSDFSVAENAGLATITVTRTGGISSEAAVQYSTSDGTAAAGTDYTAMSGTLTFDLKERSKTFTIPVSDDGVADTGAVSVELTLDTPDNGLALGSPAEATLWIVRE